MLLFKQFEFDKFDYAISFYALRNEDFDFYYRI